MIDSFTYFRYLRCFCVCVFPATAAAPAALDLLFVFCSTFPLAVAIDFYLVYPTLDIAWLEAQLGWDSAEIHIINYKLVKQFSQLLWNQSELVRVFHCNYRVFASRVQCLFFPVMWESIGHWFLINFERVWAGRGTKNSRALFAYPAVGCIISFQLHFRFELIKKCNFRLVVFSIECRLPSPSPFSCKCAPGQFSPFESSWIESSLSSKLPWLFARLKLASLADAPASLYMRCIYIYIEQSQAGSLALL